MTDPTQDPRFLQAPYPTHAAMRSRCPVQSTATRSGGQISYLVTAMRKRGKLSATLSSRRTRPPSSRARGHGVACTLRWRTPCWPATRPSTPASASW